VTAVFLGGSRAISRLNDVIRAQLNNLITRQCKILIGDANGADKAMQKYFADQNYRDVLVFCMDRPRNNLGNWEIRTLSSERKNKDSEYYATKDRAMSSEAKCSLMLWDGVSKGTLRNVMEQVEDKKRVLVYFSPKKKFFTLAAEADLENLLAECDKRDLERLKSWLQPRLHSLGQSG
jgi:hypothetical protein